MTIVILLALHCLSGLMIFLAGVIIGSALGGGFAVFLIWIWGSLGFCLIQLVYVIPLALQLKKERRIARMSGVIIGAVITALLNGVMFIILSSLS
jgi:hypothetical protein